MKKFFGKKCTLISFAIASVVLLGGLLAMLLSPVFYVGSYSGGEGNAYYDYKYKIHFKSCNKYEVTTIATQKSTGDTKTEVTEYWYYRNGDEVISLARTSVMSKEEYKEAVKQIEEMTVKEYEVFAKTSASKINLRYMEINALTSSVKYSNKSSIAFVVIDSVLLCLALTGTGLSLFYYFKSNKKKK